MLDFKNGDVIKLHRDQKTREQDIEKLLTEGETVIDTYSSVRDFVAFTNKRIISVNKQGVTGTRREMTSMPYSRVTVYSIETAGVLGYDSVLELYFTGLGRVRFEFSGNSDIVAVCRAISEHIL